MSSVHQSVLLKEMVEGLNLQEGAIVLDATFGGGGHSRYVLENVPNSKIIAFDQDQTTFKKFSNQFTTFSDRIIMINENFRNLDLVLVNQRIDKVDGIMFDLGFSSDQIESAGRGFSFLRDEPLLMTMKKDLSPEDLTATEVVNNWDEENLADIIFGFGEERYAKRIAKAIVQERKNSPIDTTRKLVEIIERAVPNVYKTRRLHFATRTFQAIRIAVNDELGALAEGLQKGFDVLGSGGRMAVISFHSLEDRMVKNFYKEKARTEIGKIISKKPLVPNSEEVQNNPRARSAKLRILEKIK